MMFDPSQFSDTYSAYNKKKLPFMGQYDGGASGPTDAHGNSIASYQAAQAAHDAWQPTPSMPPSTSINSAPNGLASIDNNPNPGQPQNLSDIMSNYGQGDPYGAQGSQMAGLNALMGGVGGPGRYGDQYMNQVGANYQQSTQPQAQAAPAAQTNPIDMNQAYMAALQNPGKVTTPGATVPQSAPPSNQSGVLQQFLNNWQQGGGNTQGAGNYNNSGFYNALKGMV